MKLVPSAELEGPREIERYVAMSEAEIDAELRAIGTSQVVTQESYVTVSFGRTVTRSRRYYCGFIHTYALTKPTGLHAAVVDGFVLRLSERGRPLN